VAFSSILPATALNNKVQACRYYIGTVGIPMSVLITLSIDHMDYVGCNGRITYHVFLSHLS
jgi:hypothetical protein